MGIQMLTSLFTTRSQLPLGQFNFKWGRPLGAGGLGKVDEIIITDSNCTLPVGSSLACKRLNAQWKDQPLARERFEREIAALRQMSHPAIVTVQAENLRGSNERFYMMPLYPKSLRDLLAATPSGFAWASAATFVAHLADALSYAHTKGFIHRDIKPENILLSASNEPIIADWGLGYFIHKESKVLQQLTRGGMGTEYYCSLEQWNTGKCNETGDVYSLGVMLAELIRGQQLPMTYVGMGISQDVVSNNTYGAQSLNTIIKTMTHFLPQSRVQSMERVAYQLREAVTFATVPL
jgi:serine/threonine protein kinase